jgi:hypothetical protein
VEVAIWRHVKHRYICRGSRNLAACKTSLHLAWKSQFGGKITGHFSPTVPPFPARDLSRRWGRGGAWRCKCRVSTISLYGCGTYGGVNLRGPTEEDNTQHTQLSNIYAPGGIRTHNPSKRAAADPLLKPRGNWDRLFVSYP